MPVSSDVNTIFAFADDQDLFHIPVALVMVPYKRKDVYILLDEVKSSFIYTYSNFLKEAGTIIEKSIIDYKEKRSNKLKKPTSFAINAIVRQKIKEKIEEQSKKKFFNYDTVNRFINKMLSKYSITSLYEESEKLAEFRENYLIKAEDEADREISLFLNKFKNFEIINFPDIQTFEEWLDKIKKSKLKIFKNKRDYEDMRIAAQFLGYNQEIGKLAFITCDKEFHRSLEIISKKFNQPVGNLTLIKPAKKKSTT